MSGITFYVSGTIDLTNGSAAVVGHSTLWTGLTDGDLLVGPDGKLYELSFTDDTHATLDRTYAGSTVSGSAYIIMRVSTARDSIGDASRKLSTVASTYRGIANFTSVDQYLKLTQGDTTKKAGLVLVANGAERYRAGLMGSGNYEIQWLKDGVWTPAVTVTPDGGVIVATSVVGKRIQARVATTGNINLSAPGSALDGITMANGDVFLADAQTTKAQNGVYVWNGAAVAATRHPDFSTFPTYIGAVITILAGSTNANTLWFCTANESGILGTTDIIFTKMTFPSGVPTGRVLTAGTGLTGGGDLTTDRSFALNDTQLAMPMRTAMMAHADKRGWPLNPSLVLAAIPEVTALPSWVSFGRSTVKYTRGPNGDFRSSAAGIIAHDYDTAGRYLGWSIEGASTNLVRNNTMQGAAVGSPGTLPTNWSIAVTPGLSREVVAVGTANGIDFIDIRVSGTTSANTGITIDVEPATGIAAVNGDNLAYSIYLALVGGSFANITSIGPRLIQYDSGGANIATGTQAAFTLPNATLSRQWALGTMNQASAAFGRNQLFLGVATNPVAIDFTLRIGWPQVEKRTTPTSPIRTTGSTATRAADVFDVTLTAPWWNATQGGIYVRGSVPYIATGNEAVEIFAALENSGGTNSIRLQKTNSSVTAFSVIDTSVSQAALNPSAVTAGTDFAMAAAWSAANFAASKDAGSVLSSLSGTVPASLTTLRVGRRGSSTNPMCGHIKQVAIFGMRPSNADLPTYSGL